MIAQGEFVYNLSRERLSRFQQNCPSKSDAIQFADTFIAMLWAPRRRARLSVSPAMAKKGWCAQHRQSEEPHRAVSTTTAHIDC